jgi:nucleoside-diphosphate-sugar epimerase
LTGTKSNKTKPNNNKTNILVKNVSILGCGWLGLPLAGLLAQKGYNVKGSSTSPNKIPLIQQAGAQAYTLSLAPNLVADSPQQFLDCDLLIINIPPKITSLGAEHHILQIQSLIAAMHSKPLVMYVSSTSVYDNVPEHKPNKTVTEAITVDPSSTLARTEKLLQETFANTTILRLAGLMGYERYPAKYYSGKPMAHWDTPVNYIHRNDATAIIATVIEQNLYGHTYNICAPLHPTRRQVIEQNCLQMNIEAPIYTVQPQHEAYKIINTQKFDLASQYQYQYPNPVYFGYTAL